MARHLVTILSVFIGLEASAMDMSFTECGNDTMSLSSTTTTIIVRTQPAEPCPAPVPPPRDTAHSLKVGRLYNQVPQDTLSALKTFVFEELVRGNTGVG